MWLRVTLSLACLAFLLRAASAMCSDAARSWYERRADIARWNSSKQAFAEQVDRFARAQGVPSCPAPPATPLPEKPWYVKLHEWGRW